MAFYKIFVVLFSLSLNNLLNVRAEGETLVLLDNQAIKETHSIFFKFLKGTVLRLGSKVSIYEIMSLTLEHYNTK